MPVLVILYIPVYIMCTSRSEQKRQTLLYLHCCCEAGIAYRQKAVYTDQQCVREGNSTLILRFKQKSNQQ